VARRYVALGAAKAVIGMYGERTGVDVFEKQRELDLAMSMESLRSGGGPSRDSQGVAHG
jgi:hypothetical protein